MEKHLFGSSRTKALEVRDKKIVEEELKYRQIEIGSQTQWIGQLLGAIRFKAFLYFEWFRI